MSDRQYEDFNVFVFPAGNHRYGARVTFPDLSVAEATFELQVSDDELAGLRAHARTVRGPARGASPAGDQEVGRAGEMDVIREFGQRLYAALIAGTIRDRYKALYNNAVGKSAGIRLRLELGQVPDLMVLPWELLFDQDAYQFVALMERTAVVRSIGVAAPSRPVDVTAPLRVLIVAPQPEGTEELMVREELQKLRTALAELEAGGKVALELVEPPTLQCLREQLSSADSYHVLHFIGHGEFDPDEEKGYLAFEAKNGGIDPVDGDLLATIVRNHESLRLVVLNSCQGAETSVSDPFAGLAQTLVRQEIPAVLAMQSAITDKSAVEFSESFYRAVGLGRPLETAVCAGRVAVRGLDILEWATPVFYTRLQDGILFRISEFSPEERKLVQDKATLAELWAPGAVTGDERVVALVFGMWDTALSDLGEVEPVVALPYALMLGELRQLLQGYYSEVRLSPRVPPEGHEGPVVYVGGPVTVPGVADVVARSEAPFWFQGLPYEGEAQRSIGAPDVAYAPELAADRRLTSDVGVAMRIEDGERLEFVIAGCYGVGTLGAARFLMHADQVRSLGDLLQAPRMIVVTRSIARGWDVQKIDAMVSRSW
jgi:CHAT domain